MTKRSDLKKTTTGRSDEGMIRTTIQPPAGKADTRQVKPYDRKLCQDPTLAPELTEEVARWLKSEKTSR